MTTPAQHQTRLNEIMGSIIKAEDTEARLKALFYGPSGVGKTVLAVATLKEILPKGKKLIYVDTSEGYLVLKNNHPGLFETIQYVLPFQSLEHLQTLSLAIKNGHPDFKDIGGIVLDEHTKMSQLDLLATQERNNPDALVPEWPDYNVALQRMVRTLHTLSSIPDMHIVLVGHERDKKNRKGEIVLTYPSYNPQVAKDVKESLHLVAYCKATPQRSMQDPTKLEYKRLAQVMPSTSIDAKTRIDKFSSYEVSYEEVVGRVRDWITRGGKPTAIEETIKNDDIPVIDVTDMEELETIEFDLDEAPAWSND